VDVACCVHGWVDVADLCDDLEMRGAVLNLLSTVQHKQLTDLHSATVNVDRHNSSLRRYQISLLYFASLTLLTGFVCITVDCGPVIIWSKFEH